jgi:hypothetical protein
MAIIYSIFTICLVSFFVKCATMIYICYACEDIMHVKTYGIIDLVECNIIQTRLVKLTSVIHC